MIIKFKTSAIKKVQNSEGETILLVRVPDFEKVQIEYERIGEHNLSAESWKKFRAAHIGNYIPMGFEPANYSIQKNGIIAAVTINKTLL